MSYWVSLYSLHFLLFFLPLIIPYSMLSLCLSDGEGGFLWALPLIPHEK